MGIVGLISLGIFLFLKQVMQNIYHPDHLQDILFFPLVPIFLDPKNINHFKTDPLCKYKSSQSAVTLITAGVVTGGNCYFLQNTWTYKRRANNSTSPPPKKQPSFYPWTVDFY